MKNFRSSLLTVGWCILLILLLMPSENFAQKQGGGGQDSAISSGSGGTPGASGDSHNGRNHPPISRGKMGPADPGGWDDYQRNMYNIIETTGLAYFFPHFLAYEEYKKLPYGKIKIKIQPDDAWVYINGHFVGIVDEFNGPFQFLRLKPGAYTRDPSCFRPGFCAEPANRSARGHQGTETGINFWGKN